MNKRKGLKKISNPKKQNFEKRSKTFRGTLVRKLYLNFQLCSSFGIKVLCWTYKCTDRYTDTQTDTENGSITEQTQKNSIFQRVVCDCYLTIYICMLCM